MGASSGATSSWISDRRALVVGLGVLIVAGTGAALLLPDQKPQVAVPDRVCQGTVPGKQVAALLPNTGDPFEEVRSTNFVADASKGLGACELSGGGQDLAISYRRIQAPEFTTETVARKSTEPGNTPISLGPATGYIGRYKAALFVPCPYKEGRNDLLEVSVEVGSASEIKDRTAREEVSELTADTARAVAREVVRCKGAAELPDIAPESP
ncbi:hypothetical protein [Streptomyces parvus]|uniref:DUF3558 domain-containing protein n=1 Tax=Streptomyces parvus TaxID=66428 RepID=A0A7K3S281_9ACTN|nr:hypothetical protein [Streptomyces parvus]NEC21616.1 hypothetical protein [Streptomyces parvus]